MPSDQINNFFKQNYRKLWQIQLIILGIVGLVIPMETHAASTIKQTTST